jgi:ABC-2 type transport system ATP-binding protein
MHLGRLVAQGELATLRAGTAPRVEVQTSQPAAAAAAFAALGLTDIHANMGTVTAQLGDIEAEAIVPALVHADVPIRGFRVAVAELEEMFVQMTGEGFDVSG